jgi:hypothetical protein
MYPLIPASGIPVGGPFGPASAPLVDGTPCLVVLVALLVAGIVLALAPLRAHLRGSPLGSVRVDPSRLPPGPEAA